MQQKAADGKMYHIALAHRIGIIFKNFRLIILWATNLSEATLISTIRR